MNADNKEPLVVLFLDALDSSELKGYLKDTYKDNIHVGDLPQMVTPSVLGRYLTGKDEAHAGLVRPTKPFEPAVNSPKIPTFLEDIDDKKMMIYNIPMTKDIEISKGMNAGSGAGGQFQDVFNLPQGNYSMVDDDPDRVFNQIVDTTVAYFSTIRTAVRNGEFDILFMSYRLLDTLTHFNYNKPEDEDGSYREVLIELVSNEVQALGEIANVLWFSDHGGMEKKETFYVNKWLEKEDYLSTTILYDNLDKMNEKQDGKVTEQVGPHNKICQVDDSSVAVSYDAYDASVDVLDEDAPVDEIIEGLEDTGYFEYVKHKSELYDEEAPNYDDLPDIIPKRKPGIMVSGNIHKDGGPGGKCQGEFREGVHSPRACFGFNFDFDHSMFKKDEIKAEDFNHILKKAFITAPVVRKEAGEGAGELSEDEDEQIQERLKNLGYV